MQDLNAEDKQELIELNRVQIAAWEMIKDNDGRLSEHCEGLLKTHRIALAALTAQPVELPKSERVANGYYFDMNDVFVALESAGVKFEVQE